MKQMELLKQVALVGRGTAVDLFTRSLHPAVRGRHFDWNALPEKAAQEASKQVTEFIDDELWHAAKQAIVQLAADEAREQIEIMLEQSGVRGWIGSHRPRKRKKRRKKNRG